MNSYTNLMEYRSAAMIVGIVYIPTHCDIYISQAHPCMAYDTTLIAYSMK